MSDMSKRLREALAELVRLKLMKEQSEVLRRSPHGNPLTIQDLIQEYESNKEAAWTRAKEVLAEPADALEAQGDLYKASDKVLKWWSKRHVSSCATVIPSSVIAELQSALAKANQTLPTPPTGDAL